MPPLQSLTGILESNPELVVIVAVAVRLLRAYQTDLSWPEYRPLHRFKRGVFPLLQRVAPVTSWVNDKGGRDDGEFVRTVDVSVRRAVRDLRDAGASLHLICSLKRRPDTHGDPLTAAHLVWFVDGDDQVEAYLFRNADGSVDLYCHTEAEVDDPLAHLGGASQRDGDGYGVLPDAYAAA